RSPTLSVPAVQRPLGYGTGPAKRLEGPGQTHGEPTAWLRLHQVARVDLEGGWVARGNHAHERQRLGGGAPEAEDALSVDRGARSQVPLRIDARNGEHARVPVSIDVPDADRTGNWLRLPKLRQELLAHWGTAARHGVPSGLRGKAPVRPQGDVAQRRRADQRVELRVEIPDRVTERRHQERRQTRPERRDRGGAAERER